MREARFTDGRVTDLGIADLFTRRHRWRVWLAVEGALAQAEADLGMIPAAAGPAIASARDRVDLDRVAERVARSSHPLAGLISELTETVGPPLDAWVHWGATTQNITQTGDTVLVHRAHRILLGELAAILGSAADLAERTAEVVLPGRTHGQHAVPTTYGFIVATWLDELVRHGERLRAIEPRVFVATVGGAIGTFASFGERGPEVQAAVAERLGLRSSPLPARTALDPLVEYVSLLAMLAATVGRIGRAIAVGMQPEFGEVAEPQGDEVVGSSTMPHKRNPQLCADLIAISARIRALVPLALDGLQGDHEADASAEAVVTDAVIQACTLIAAALPRLRVVVAGLTVDADRMRANLDLSAGLTRSEAVMLCLGRLIGRQPAHEIVREVARTASETGASFADALAADPRVTAHLNPAELLAAAPDTGLSAQIAREQAARARECAVALTA